MNLHRQILLSYFVWPKILTLSGEVFVQITADCKSWIRTFL